VTKREGTVLGIFLTLILFIFIFTQFTIFIIPPIDALPKGKTILIFRLSSGKFIDSPDAMCKRVEGSLNSLCRLAVVNAVLKKSKILVKLPYSKILYRISIAGKTDSH
jgi:hypothetical protein